MISELKKRLATKSVGLKLTKKAAEFLIDKGYDPKNGARPLRRAIEDHLESILSEALISEKLKKGEIAVVDLKDDKLELEIEQKEK